MQLYQTFIGSYRLVHLYVANDELDSYAVTQMIVHTMQQYVMHAMCTDANTITVNIHTHFQSAHHVQVPVGAWM